MKNSTPINLPETFTGRYSAIDPLDSRYYDKAISRALSEGTRIFYQAHIEGVLAKELANSGVCTQEIADEICAAAANIDLDIVAEEEKITKHDVKALVNAIKLQVSDQAKPFVHFGATSYDIVATAHSMQLKQASEELILPRLKELVDTLSDLATRYADTVQIGRTHGQHGVPITFGFAVAEYVARLTDSYVRIEELSGCLHGKFSGAVGGYNALSVFVDDPIAFEKAIVEFVGLKVAPYSNQIVPADGVVRLIDELAVAAGIMANIGHDMRNLQRSEIAEIREQFTDGQTGSSTMAHKRNPWNFENVVSMSKQVTAQIVNAHMNLPSEHQRDLTDSASSRFYTVVFALVASMTKRLNGVMSRIEVDEEAIRHNLKMSGGVIAAEPLYLLLEKQGHTLAHEKSKILSHKALTESRSLVEVIEEDEEARGYWEKFTDYEKQIVTNPETHYIGLSSQKAKMVVEESKARLNLKS